MEIGKFFCVKHSKNVSTLRVLFIDLENNPSCVLLFFLYSLHVRYVCEEYVNVLTIEELTFIVENVVKSCNKQLNLVQEKLREVLHEHLFISKNYTNHKFTNKHNFYTVHNP